MTMHDDRYGPARAGGRRLVTGALSVALAAGAAALVPAGAPAQQLDPPPPPADSGTLVQVVPGARYEAGALRRLFNGANRRDLWLRELTVPLLDLDRFAGGLRAEDSGGNQSKTLHLVNAKGETYIFRSTDKYARQLLPPDLQGTLFNTLMQDHMSVFHPGAAAVVPRLHEELGLLAIPPAFRVMPDDPALGEYRETFAGMLGQMVLRPNEGPRAEALFAGSHRIVGTEELLDKLEDHPRNQVDAEEYLADRLVDFLVGDTDRGPDQWRWARAPEEWGFRWRPIVRDRDWAFMDANGLLSRATRLVYPKLVTFEDRLPEVGALTWADVGLGRSLLAGLDRGAFRAVAERVQRTLTDDVIDDAVRRLPPEQQPGHADALAARLKTRRAGLVERAMEFYERLSTDVDIRGTDLPDRAEINRRPDGSVEVVLLAPGPVMVPVVTADDDDDPTEYAADPYYDPAFDYDDGAEPSSWQAYYRRVFDPAETREVRVYLHGDDDRAEVSGAGTGAITVRIIGGGGDDRLADRGEPSRATAFYDDEGDNVLEPGPRTRVDRRPFDAPEASGRFAVHKLGYDRFRDWGSEFSWATPVVDYREGGGLIVGAGPTWTDFGFRRRPYARKLSVKALYATRAERPGVDAEAEMWLENRPVALTAHGRWSGFEAFRFYGFGNDAPAVATDQALIYHDEALLEGRLVVEAERWEVEVGPFVRHLEPDVPAGNPAAGTDLPGVDALTEAGVAGELDFVAGDAGSAPRTGLRFLLNGEGVPGVTDSGAAYGRAEGEVRAYVSAPLLTEPVLAVRVGGRQAWGDYPIHGAANIGGLSTLRGYRWQRFAGDAAVFGGVDLRIPLFRANLLIARGRLGVLGSADAGRVYVDGDSPGDWHTSHGAGLFFETMGTAVFAQWARGDEDRYYVGLGLPF
jgi:hypothetical protein